MTKIAFHKIRRDGGKFEARAGGRVLGMFDSELEADVALNRARADGDFKEEDHPRDKDGKFGSGEGGGSKEEKEKRYSELHAHEKAYVQKAIKGTQTDKDRKEMEPLSAEKDRLYRDPEIEKHVAGIDFHENQKAANDHVADLQKAGLRVMPQDRKSWNPRTGETIKPNESFEEHWARTEAKRNGTYKEEPKPAKEKSTPRPMTEERVEKKMETLHRNGSNWSDEAHDAHNMGDAESAGNAAKEAGKYAQKASKLAYSGPATQKAHDEASQMHTEASQAHHEAAQAFRKFGSESHKAALGSPENKAYSEKQALKHEAKATEHEAKATEHREGGRESTTGRSKPNMSGSGSPLPPNKRPK